MSTVAQRRKRKAARIQERAKPSAPHVATQRLTEYFSNRGVSLKVDRENGVIPGVKILGKVSKNGRRYTEQCIARAVNLYEGAKVNVNHPKGQPSDPRDYEDRLGQIKNARIDEQGELSGDLHFNPHHALAEQLCWDAEHAPENVGLSHNVDAKTKLDGKQLVVEEILIVRAADLVADPATTKSLYEYDNPTLQGSAGRMPDSNLPAATDAHMIPGTPPAKLKEDDPDMDEDNDTSGDPKGAICKAYNDKINALVADEEADPMETAAQIKKLLQARAKSLQSMDDALGGDDDGEDDDESTEEHVKRRLAKGAQTVTEQNKELAEAKAKLQMLERKDSARKALELSGLPPQMCTELFVKQLAEADNATQKLMIDERMMLAENMKLQRPKSRDEAYLEGYDPAATRKGPPKSAKELVEAVQAIDD